MLATPAYVKHHQCEKPFYVLRVDRRWILSTIARMFSRVLIVPTPCLSELTETLRKRPLSLNVWWIRLNTRLDGILRSGKGVRYSSTEASELPLQKPCTKCMSQYSTWEYTKGILAAQYTCQTITNKPQRLLNQLAASAGKCISRQRL
jgi:hypothetical protein